MDIAAVGADRALAEQRIVGRHFLHLGDHGLAVGSAFQRRDRLQIMHDRRIDAGLHHGREFARPLGLPALGPGAVGVVHVPIPCFGQNQTLRDFQSERINVGDEHQQAGEMLAAGGDAEFGALLDRIDGVAAGIGQPDDLGFRCLRLQQERREVLVFSGRLTAPSTLPPLARTTAVVSRSSAWPKA